MKLEIRDKDVEKPCHELKYCPYGIVVESMPLHTGKDRVCDVFGHECPVYYLKEDKTELSG